MDEADARSAQALGKEPREIDLEAARKDDLRPLDGTDLEAGLAEIETDEQLARRRGRGLRARGDRSEHARGQKDEEKEGSHRERERTITRVPTGGCR